LWKLRGNRLIEQILAKFNLLDPDFNICRSDEEQHRVPWASRVMGDLSGNIRNNYGPNYHK
jgi:hypothetical protein